MARSHYFFFPIELNQLEKLVEDHRSHFNDLLEDSFTDDELTIFEEKIESIAAIYPQPILSEMTIDDFNLLDGEEKAQRFFFESCRSSLCVENLPYFETNPFQVSYLRILLDKFSNFLVDTAGVSPLSFKAHYMKDLETYKSMDHLIKDYVPAPKKVALHIPQSPVDFLILDVYKELDRLGDRATIDGQSDKMRWLYYAMKAEKLHHDALLSKCGLNPKDFDDYLEKLKFYLRKIP